MARMFVMSVIVLIVINLSLMTCINNKTCPLQNINSKRSKRITVLVSPISYRYRIDRNVRKINDWINMEYVDQWLDDTYAKMFLIYLLAIENQCFNCIGTTTIISNKTAIYISNHWIF
ncbi:PREDICTED: uncharacterized protein LOC105152912 [Acromyrmex echinatior]|uniref:uncharacterized protein LOC105152912 n=1 Tax=Acromyrmex echinatior TaxID=103372 RepID=UPI000580E455|nr:PREDICTED: uncharacterized protein LOC105152912 [Acromyrmex echinatior]